MKNVQRAVEQRRDTRNVGGGHRMSWRTEGMGNTVDNAGRIRNTLDTREATRLQKTSEGMDVRGRPWKAVAHRTLGGGRGGTRKLKEARQDHGRLWKTTEDCAVLQEGKDVAGLTEFAEDRRSRRKTVQCCRRARTLQDSLKLQRS